MAKSGSSAGKVDLFLHQRVTVDFPAGPCPLRGQECPSTARVSVRHRPECPSPLVSCSFRVLPKRLKEGVPQRQTDPPGATQTLSLLRQNQPVHTLGLLCQVPNPRDKFVMDQARILSKFPILACWGRGNLLRGVGNLSALLCNPGHLSHPDPPSLLPNTQILSLLAGTALPGCSCLAHALLRCGWGMWWSLLHGTGTRSSLPGVCGEAGRARGCAGAGEMSEEWESQEGGPGPGDSSSCGHRAPEVTSGGTHRWTWRGQSQREPHCNPGKCCCKRSFWRSIYSEHFHLQALPCFWWQNAEVLLRAMLS